MQLDGPPRTSILRTKLGAAACMLLASGMPAAVRADTGTTTRVDVNALLYGEQSRANVAEPTARVTRLLATSSTVTRRRPDTPGATSVMGSIKIHNPHTTTVQNAADRTMVRPRRRRTVGVDGRRAVSQTAQPA